MPDYNDNYDYSLGTDENLARENDLLGFAEEIVNYVLNEFEGGDWKETFSILDDDDKRFLFKAIADGFNDSIDN